MPYHVGVRLKSGEIAKRYAENMAQLPDVTDDGETIIVLHHVDDFPFTADMCNAARANRQFWRQAYAAGGVSYPE